MSLCLFRNFAKNLIIINSQFRSHNVIKPLSICNQIFLKYSSDSPKKPLIKKKRRISSSSEEEENTSPKNNL